MTGLATGLGLLTAVGAGIPVVGFLLPPRGTLSDPDLIRAGATDKLEEGSARPILFHGVPVFLIRLAGDRFFALSAICTHMKVCRLEWDADRSLLLCPCHGGSFDVHGNVVRGPASTPLTSYAVDQVGDELFIRREG
jgi:cytochrome b6-f complex iron-sulfur subunit